MTEQLIHTTLRRTKKLLTTKLCNT